MNKNKNTDKQKEAAALATKLAATTPLTEFMDAVEARLNAYDKRDEKLVEPRKINHH